METYALAPLFIESVRKNLPSVMVEFDDILSKCIPSESLAKLLGNDADLLKSIGCSSKTDSKIWRSLILPKYLTKQARGIFYDIVGDSSHRPTLFGQRCSWLDTSIKSKATDELEAYREVREKVQNVAKSTDTGGEDMWEHIANAHLDTLDSEYSS